MRAIMMRGLQVGILLMFAGVAQAAATYDCALGNASNYTQTYSELANASTLLTVQVTCRRRGNGPGLSINYTVTPDSGFNASGTQNRAVLGGQYINYDLYTDSSCTAPWSGSGTILLSGTKKNDSATQTLTYYGCVPAAQPALPAAGNNYSDTVNLTLATSTPPVVIIGTNPRSFNVRIRVNATCTLSMPGNVNFGTYTAFQPGAKTASATFSATCTNMTPYTLSLDATGGVVSGLTYSLLLNTTGTGGTHPFGPVPGTGTAQAYFINGTMPANQAGTCAGASCPGSNPHTLTITY